MERENHTLSAKPVRTMDIPRHRNKILAKLIDWKKSLLLCIVGLLGIVSIAFDPALLQTLPPNISQQFTQNQLRLLLIINPILYLLIAVVVGSIVYKRVGLTLWPTEKEGYLSQLAQVGKAGLLPGLLAGLTILLGAALFQQLIPGELQVLNAQVQPSVFTRLLYGGLTEEILIRFGLMSLFIWLFKRFFPNHDNASYQISIVVAALVFACGHLPVTFLLLPHPSAGLISYIILLNGIAGSIYGWVFWKRNLAAAMVAHALSHLVLLISQVWLMI